MPNGVQINAYVPKGLVKALEAVAAAMGEGDIGIRPTRSQLVTKAIENFLQACRCREDLRRAIEAAGKQSQTEVAGGSIRAKSERLRVVAPAS
jgi:hypothetical protein